MDEKTEKNIEIKLSIGGINLYKINNDEKTDKINDDEKFDNINIEEKITLEDKERIFIFEESLSTYISGILFGGIFTIISIFLGIIISSPFNNIDKVETGLSYDKVMNISSRFLWFFLFLLIFYLDKNKKKKKVEEYKKNFIYPKYHK